MSHQTLIKTIQSELEKINDEIDLKIIRGIAYRKEAQRHKFLLSHLTRAVRKDRTGWLHRAAHMMSSFLL
jgi:hypothetical protein